jgi:hypothetical protein
VNGCENVVGVCCEKVSRCVTVKMLRVCVVRECEDYVCFE